MASCLQQVFLSYLHCFVQGGNTTAQAKYRCHNSTIIQLLFASAIIIGQRIGKNPLRMMFEKTIQLTEQGWRILTRNFSLFFILMAGVNELVWRNVPTETWVNFKVFGVLGLTVIYIFLQMVWIQRFAITPPQQDDTPPQSS
jgi:intracellular septation protein